MAMVLYLDTAAKILSLFLLRISLNGFELNWTELNFTATERADREGYEA